MNHETKEHLESGVFTSEYTDSIPPAKIHPALHVDPEGVMVGLITETGDYQIYSSAQRQYSLEQLKDQLLFVPRPYPDLVGRWPTPDAARFIVSGTAPTLAEVVVVTIKLLRDAMEFPKTEQAILVALWGIATYFFPFFLTFP